MAITELRPGRFQVLPVVIKNIIIINVIMVLLSLTLFSTFHIDLGDHLALHYWRSGLFKPWQLVTHMFMHGTADPRGLQMTIGHLFFNMFGLWMVGATLENIWGPRRFIIFYLFCGVGAALCQLGVQAIHLEPIAKALNAQAMIDPAHRAMRDLVFSTRPGGAAHNVFDTGLVGASGAVFGVLFAFAWLFPNTMFYFYFLFPVKAKWFVAGYAVIELFSGIWTSAGDNVAHFAHLGGMLFGFILLKIWNTRLRDRYY